MKCNTTLGRGTVLVLDTLEELEYLCSLPWVESYMCSVQFSCSVVSNSWQPHGLQHARLPCPSPTLRACSDSCPLSQWCHPTISYSVASFSCLQSFPASGSFLRSQFFSSGGQSIRASASVLPMNMQDCFLLGLTGLISLQSKGLSRVFSNTTVQKCQRPACVVLNKLSKPFWASVSHLKLWAWWHCTLVKRMLMATVVIVKCGTGGTMEW